MKILTQVSLWAICIGATTGFGKVAETPPLGWNSFDSYSCSLYEERALMEADAFIEKFAPHGYEYFVIDNGWFSNPESVRKDGLLLPVNTHADPKDVEVNEFGIVQPSSLSAKIR